MSRLVFVVDDDEDARDSVRVLVNSMGIRAEPYSSAEDFLAGHVEGRSGCLVTDIRMLGMSGIELQERLIEQNISLPVIVLTAYARTRTTVRAMAAGAVTLLEKPYDDEELWDAIRKALARDAQRREGAQRQREIRLRVNHLTPRERAVMAPDRSRTAKQDNRREAWNQRQSPWRIVAAQSFPKCRRTPWPS